MKHLVFEAKDGESLVAHGGSGRGESKSKFSNQIYNFCKNMGHIKKDCYKLQNKERLAAKRYVTQSDISEEDWILDLAYVFHMYPNKDLFTTYDEIVSKYVMVMGNNAHYRVVRICIVRLKLLDETIRPVVQVRYVPDLKKNLISLVILDSKGYEFFGGGGDLKVCKGAQVYWMDIKCLNYTSCRVLQNLEESINTSLVPWWTFSLVQYLQELVNVSFEEYNSVKFKRYR
ncbi:unnamed protein product [Fraxinus pennsylvanica]|uniref:Retrovirus-related Pol polyprotein from transposon TNT 1-94-like beta-barrel domain-containing protein n=1 Tax=Fraxinus pennsylvanica TaxID=56036 RepID=A0AAD1YVL0_9LAMI|nr:unnamed protein product [Fraxinus pennsylvanica]